MWILSIFQRNKAYKLRKKYDRVREKTDRLKDYNRKMPILRMLDTVEPNLILLEENRIQSHFEQRRMLAQIEACVENAQELLKMKEAR